MKNIVAAAEIKNLIHNVRGKAVMLDSDLARLYQVETRALNQAVRRNLDRFPEDFMFRLTKEEESGRLAGHRSRVARTRRQGWRKRAAMRSIGQPEG